MSPFSQLPLNACLHFFDYKEWFILIYFAPFSINMKNIFNEYDYLASIILTQMA